MTPYFFTLFLTTILGTLSDEKVNRKPFIMVNGLILILFAGLRDSSVGTDTNGYVYSYLWHQRDSLNLFSGASTSIEIGYQFLEAVAHQFSSQYYSILLLISSITIIFQLKGIYALSQKLSLSIFVLITLGFYTFTFNGARQGIALAIFIYSIQFIVNNKFKHFLFFIGLGFIFHRSIIVTLPLYFLFRFKFNIKLIILLVISTMVSISYFDEMLSIGLLISDKYKIYTVLEASGGRVLTIAYTIYGIFFIFMKTFLKDQDIKEYDIYLNLYSIGTIIFFIVQFTGAYIEITRLAIYFLSSSIFIWPIIFKRISYDLKPFVFIFFATSHLIFYYTLISRIGDLMPYTLNTSLFN